MFDLNSIRLRRRWLYPSLGLFAMMAALSALTANSLRKPIHWIAQKTLGRDLWIDGDLSVSLGKVIVIRAHGLRLANRAGAAQPEMLQVEHLALGLDPWATLRHLRVVLTRAEIDNLRILVERDETGRLNWNFASETQESSSQSEPENSERQNKSDSSLPLTVQSVSLRKGSATIFEKVILLDALDAAFPSDLARFLAFSSGKIDKNSWTLNADVNNIHLERPQFDNLEVQARVEALDASLEATGKLSGLNFSGQTHLKGKNLKQALMIIGYEMNGEITSYEAKAYLHFERPRLTLQDLSASFNDSTLRDAFSGDFGTPIAIKADLDSESLVFRDFGAFLPAAVGRETPGARLKGAPNGGNDPEKPEETKLFSTKPIQLGGKNFRGSMLLSMHVVSRAMEKQR